MTERKLDQNIFVERTVIISVMVMILLVFIVIIGVLTWPQRTLAKVERLIARQQYQEAEVLIEEYESKIVGSDLEKHKETCTYNIAKAELDAGNIENARYRLESLNDYMDTKELLKECDYIDAVNLLEDEQFEKAYVLFSFIIGYKDTNDKLLICRYSIAQSTYQNGDFAKALDMFTALGDYEESEDMADMLAMKVTGTDNIEDAYQILEGMNFEEIQNIAKLTEARDALLKNIIAAGAHHTVGLNSDGTVTATGRNDEGQCNVDELEDIVAIDAGYYHTVALNSDGTVTATGRNIEGQCEVDDWSEVAAIAAGAYSTYGLLMDGTVVSTGLVYSETDELSDIKYINAGSYAGVFLDINGTIYVTHQSLYISDEGAIEADIFTGYVVALMPNGTVSSNLTYTDEWEDIVTISAGAKVILGIKSDGTTEAYFFRERDKVMLEYDNVAAVSAGGGHSVIVLSDGSVVAFGENGSGQCNVNNWDLITEDD